MNLKVPLTLLAASVLFGCGQVEVAPDKPLPKVKAIELGEKLQQDQMFFPAVAEAADKSALSFRVSGEISKLVVKEGDKVKKGQLIAQLDPTDYQLKVNNAQAKYSVADSQYRRSEPLVKKGLLAQSQFDELAAQRQIALAELELAKLHLSFTQLKAPISGVISRVAVDQFENIQVGQQIVNIHSLDQVDVLIQIPDRLFVEQPKDMDVTKIEVMVRVKEGVEYPAAIKEYTTEPDPKTATYNVTLTMPMPDDSIILDGMAVEVAAQGKNTGLTLKRGISIPVEAIFNADGDELSRDNKYVWVLGDNGEVRKTKVETGKVNFDEIQIVNGLEQGQQIVIAGVARLRDGMKVEVISQEAGK
ncbi:efflux RND transporter periplasmic adaptor subunit [Vibrio nigripulchritudo]|uniref:efflux RND transporter periplasmic adaptor subunit n=1 Tax=Vibrio nigripulchritudo TaxID=28173 RepID=UPI0024929900|nr:efflux RND transporter periplasmic adaptor subunit [Vibrio nigripulchritudo]BDU37505.1 hemolysin secretion protein D [Vibrio nigripulchritudo]BDU43225.1 hemolysin secretion protein D [Vibrio nigripulchritudo]